MSKVVVELFEVLYFVLNFVYYIFICLEVEKCRVDNFMAFGVDLIMIEFSIIIDLFIGEVQLEFLGVMPLYSNMGVIFFQNIF